jgi:hypothetical protein
MSESESGEASGLLVSESSSMAGYGGGGVESGKGKREEGGRTARLLCGRVGRRECTGRCLLGRAAWWRPSPVTGGAVAVTVGSW